MTKDYCHEDTKFTEYLSSFFSIHFYIKHVHICFLQLLRYIKKSIVTIHARTRTPTHIFLCVTINNIEHVCACFFLFSSLFPNSYVTFKKTLNFYTSSTRLRRPLQCFKNVKKSEQKGTKKKPKRHAKKTREVKLRKHFSSV